MVLGITISPIFRPGRQRSNKVGDLLSSDLSNQLDVKNASIWRQYSNAWRIGKDVNVTAKHRPIGHIARVFGEPAPWTKYAGPGGWNDLDALQISNGPLDGLSNDERQTMMTFWAVEAATSLSG